MEDIIHLLPDSVANQIAAGEVVQRPSSIIKEMVENSIDAGATRIQIFVVDGGKTLVQVIDNGKGMSEMDARLSFERHATSKIRQASDLYNLHTMGFRGEALASIAAVAQVELKTRREVDELGTMIQIAGSQIVVQEPVACPVGANFSVKNLFFNVPARRKFLKSNSTELANIVAELEHIALVYPQIEFSLSSNGSALYHLPVCNTRKRIADIFGKKLDATLLPIDVETSIVSLTGYVASPDSSRKKGCKQFFFVNGRYMRHPYFHSAVMHAYEELIPAGDHVSYFIYFSVDPSAIDVNVHPTKTEIKFDNEQPIWQVLEAAVRESLGRFYQVPTIDFDVVDRPNIPVAGASGSYTAAPPRHQVDYNPFRPEPSSTQVDTDWPLLYGGMENFEATGRNIPAMGSLVGSHEVSALQSLMQGAGAASNLDYEGQPTLWKGAKDENIVAQNEFAMVSTLPRFQYKGRWIVVPISSGLLLVDQQRAHTRVLYESYLSNMAQRNHVSQGMLFPEIVEFSQSEQVVVEGLMQELHSLGFEITNLGGGSYSLSAAPPDLDGVSPSRLLHDLVAAALEHENGVKEEIEKSMALTIARSVSVVHGQVLTHEEMGRLLNDLFALSSPMRTPDGKMVFSVISDSEIEKLF